MLWCNLYLFTWTNNKIYFLLCKLHHKFFLSSNPVPHPIYTYPLPSLVSFPLPGSGSTIILELSGHNGILHQCSQLLQDQVAVGQVYVSPTPEQGSHDIQAFTTISDVKMSMWGTEQDVYVCVFVCVSSLVYETEHFISIFKNAFW